LGEEKGNRLKGGSALPQRGGYPEGCDGKSGIFKTHQVTHASMAAGIVSVKTGSAVKKLGVDNSLIERREGKEELKPSGGRTMGEGSLRPKKSSLRQKFGVALKGIVREKLDLREKRAFEPPKEGARVRLWKQKRF